MVGTRGCAPVEVELPRARVTFATCVRGLLALSFLIMSCSSVSAQQPAARRMSTNLVQFDIPFQINAADSAFLEVHLYASTDRGATWQFLGRQATSATGFPFQSTGDGEYWFALKTLTRDRKLVPEGDPSPELIVTVDRDQPELSFNAQTDAAGRVVVQWDARDKNIDPDSIRISYRSASADIPGGGPGQWMPVPYKSTRPIINGIFNDAIAWWPDTTQRALNIRIELSDHAGNRVLENRNVNVPEVSWRSRNRSTTHQGDSINTSRPAYPRSTYPPVGWSAQRSPSGQQTAGLPADPTEPAQHQIASATNGPNQNPNNPVETGPGGVRRLPAGGVAAAANQPISARVAPAPAPLVGSTPEYVAPPVPPGFSPAQVSPAPDAGPPSGDDATRVARQQGYGQQPAPPVQSHRPGMTHRGGSNIAWDGRLEQNPAIRRSTTGTTEGTGGTFPGSQPQPLNHNQVVQSNRVSPNPGRTNPGLANRGQQDSQAPIRRTPDGMFVSESTTASPTGQRPAQYSPQQSPNIPLPPSLNPDTLTPGQAAREIPSLAHSSGPVGDQQQQQTSNPAAEMLAVSNPSGTSPGPPGQSSSVRPADPSQIIPVNSRRFNLSYSVDAIDPSGVKRVDLWVTHDGGQTWKPWGTDPDSETPFPVEVEESGVYAFRIVVHSRDGLTGRAPSRGDRPDMWVEVDTDAPTVRITSVPYGRGAEAGRLVVNWEASDPNLTLRPIAIKYAVHPNGPWTTIESGVRNTGRYLWKPGPEVPERLLVRIEARDTAGNTGVFLLNELLDVSGLVPRGHIHGVAPVGR